ncbi:MAG: hypothetical protein KF867_03410 [Cryobacterium sp.]|nr:hypothetical protein [Cryobacterium sp.]
MVIKATDFVLVPVDLLDAVVTYGNWLEANGFRLEAEPYDLEYPNSPVLKGVRAQQSHFYEVASSVNVLRAEEWVKYGRASTQDTRYVVAIANGNSVSPSELSRLRELGVGVDIIENSSVNHLCPAHDLSLNVEFPTLSKKLHRSLGNARDLFSQGNWKESFEDACQALETEARDYLRKAVRGGRVSFVNDRGKTVVYTEAQVSGMTLGGLAIAFTNLVGPTQTESRVAQALTRINPRRVTVAHFKYKSGKRARDLRTQVGKDLIVIVNSMKMLTGG